MDYLSSYWSLMFSLYFLSRVELVGCVRCISGVFDALNDETSKTVSHIRSVEMKRTAARRLLLIFP